MLVENMKYLSTFSGIGGFEIPMQELGWECVGFSEVDKYATEIYQKHFPSHTSYGDITRIEPSTLPDFDMLVGGFPCQSFSIAGKRGGFSDTRGTLFFYLAEIARVKRPRYLFLENVKGLLSHDEGNTFATIISTIDELGYDCQWQVLNSKNFGVPQNRERVFIIGHLRGTSRSKVFPIGEEFGVYDEERELSNRRAINRKDFSGKRIQERHENKHSIRQLNNPKHSNDRVYSSDGISPTLNTMQGGNRQPFILRDGRDNRSCLRAGRTTEIGVKGKSIRRLTPNECARLQGFPDNWHEGVSDTQAYKCYGNAVTVNVIREIVQRFQ